MENENLNQTKEKMIKRCKKIGDVMEIGFWLIIIMLILGAAVLVLDASVMWRDGASGMEIINSSTSLIMDLFNIEKDFTEINAIKESIIGIIVSILSSIVLYALAKIFQNTSKDETPFSVDNVKNMKKISVCAYIVFIVTLFSQVYGLGLIYVLAIGGIEYIFKYGYQLQLESDETL